MMHLILSYIYPMSVGLIFVMGLLWEFLEWLAGKLLGFWVNGIDLGLSKDRNIQYLDPRQIGSLKDLWFNALGNISGLLIRFISLGI